MLIPKMPIAPGYSPNSKEDNGGTPPQRPSAPKPPECRVLCGRCRSVMSESEYKEHKCGLVWLLDKLFGGK